MYLLIFVFVVFLVCVAFTWNEGAWNNIVTFLNAFFSGIFATNYYGLLSIFFGYRSGSLVEYTGSAIYLWDVLWFWVLFGMMFATLRFIADRLGKFKIKFRKPVEIATNAIMSMAVAMLMVTLFLFALHIAPLPRHPFGGAFQRSPTARHLLIGPDRIWMSLAGYWSSPFGPLSNLFSVNRFGSSQDFIERHYWRRRTLEGEDGFFVERDAPYTQQQ